MLTTPRAVSASLTPVVRPLRSSLAMLLACLALICGTVLALPSSNARATTTTMTPGSVYHAQLLAAVNAERTKRGIPALRLSTCLNDSYAQPWAIYMAVHHTLVHQSLSKMLTGCHAQVAAENIGRGAVSASAMVAAFMASAPHRANILSRSLHYIGVGGAHSHSYTWYVCLDFSG